MSQKRYFDFNLSIVAGDTYDHPLVFTDEDGDPIDISGDNFRLTVRSDWATTDDSDDSEAVFILDSEEATEMTIDDSGTGTDDRLTLHFVSSMTNQTAGDYVMDLQWEPSGSGVKTISRGVLTIEAQATVRTAAE